MEAGEECDCGSVQVRDWCGRRHGTGARARESLGGEGQGLPTSLPLSPRPSGVQPCGRELLQEMHPDSRRHVQRRALLSPLQGKGHLPPGRDGGGTRRGQTAGFPMRGGTQGGGAAGGGANAGAGHETKKAPMERDEGRGVRPQGLLKAGLRGPGRGTDPEAVGGAEP